MRTFGEGQWKQIGISFPVLKLLGEVSEKELSVGTWVLHKPKDL